MKRKHILILVENLSVPFDRRVWAESRALVDAGMDVTVICPAGTTYDTEPEAVIDGVRILRYRLRAASAGPLGYLREYGFALWHTLRLAIRVRLERRVDVVHACNPPDLLFLVALVLRPTGARFVFDHHDLVPELFLSRFPGRGRSLYRITKVLERLTFAAADAVISTNESYRRVAVERGKVDPDKVVVVRSAPDLDRFVPRPPDQALRRGKRYLLAYLGVMGPQDGVDYALRAVHALRYDIGRDDFHCTFMGSGDAFDDLVKLAAELGIADVVEFTGRVPDEMVQRCLSTADVCLSPDPKNPLNDVSTMNKVVEYMAMGRPIVSFDLQEARVSAGQAAVYIPDNDESAFAEAIDAMLDDPVRRRRMGELGRQRVESELSWEVSRRNLIGFYERLLDGRFNVRRLHFALHRPVRRHAVVAMLLCVMLAMSCGSAPASPPGFVGDFETGNFDQWPICQNPAVGSAACTSYRDPSYSMQVQGNVVRQGQFAARFELRPGDHPAQPCCGHRAEVSGEELTAAGEGDDRWYQWSTLFGGDFPAGEGWSVVSQWHANRDGPPPVAISAGPTNVSSDRWGLVLSTWNSPGNPGPTFTPWSVPLVRGVWNDLKLHIKWSASDASGFVELWLNGSPQTFTAAPCSGQTRCMVRTLMPGGGGVYFKQGYYRDPAIPFAGSVYHDGFSQSLTEAGLRPL